LVIAFVADACYEASSGGPRSAQRFVDRLSRNHEMRVVTTGRPGPGRILLPGFYPPFAGRIMREMDFVFAWPRTRTLEAAFAGVDVVHLQFPFLLGFRGLRIARQMGLPVVAGFHVQPENMFYNLGIRSEKAVHRLYRFFVEKYYNHASVVVCPSAFAEAELKRHGLTAPSVVISNGIAPQYRPTEEQREDIGDEKFIVLTVGRLAREKRHDVLIDAVSLSRHRSRIRLMLCGKGPARDRIIRMGKRLPHPPRVFSPSDEELIRLYNTADLYVHTSEIELEGMSVLEAMGCGLPFVVSNSRSSASRQFAADERFLFEANSPRALAERIDYWIERPQELRAAAEECLRTTRRYRLEDSVKRLEEVYRACVEGRSP